MIATRADLIEIDGLWHSRILQFVGPETHVLLRIPTISNRHAQIGAIVLGWWFGACGPVGIQ